MMQNYTKPNKNKECKKLATKKADQSRGTQPDSNSQLKLQLNFVDTPEAVAVAVEVAASDGCCDGSKQAKKIAYEQLKAQQGK